MRSTPGGDEHRKRGLLYGDRTLSSEKTVERPRSQEEVAQAALRDRITAASLVVVGSVSTISMVAYVKDRPVSHHDPIWKKAVIRIETVEKGARSEKTVEIVFPGSNDVRWHTAPKFSEGQEGVWILRKTTIPDFKTEAYTALHPYDIHSTAQISSIRAIIKGQEGG